VQGEGTNVQTVYKTESTERRQHNLPGPFLRIFPWGAFLEKGPFCEIIYRRGIAMAEGHVCGQYTTHECGGLGVYSPRKF
jgi:hypothetical protein